MTKLHWVGTSAIMAAVAWALVLAGPGLADARATLTAPQATVDAGGPDALLVVGAAGLAWLTWAWGALGLLLTALSALPGLPGRVAAGVAAAVLPNGARRAAALALGLSLSVTAPLAASGLRTGPVAGPAGVVTASAAVPLDRSAPAPDWRPGGSPAAPDWPAAPGAGSAPGEHVVVRGDCLWDLARAHLTAAATGAPVTDAQVAAAAHAWWRANAAVIGPDPDLLLPGQVLRPPPA
ncbi:hypothetical protein [Modestobacter sp. NPDC049651]|uniref:hypothetical protein n=1 Tax=unclassified Modestobacter TaxID=2643866 RepID=UPI0034062DA0